MYIILQKYKILTTCLGESASAGTGINISTSLAVDRLLNCPLAYRNIRDSGIQQETLMLSSDKISSLP